MEGNDENVCSVIKNANSHRWCCVMSVLILTSLFLLFVFETHPFSSCWKDVMKYITTLLLQAQNTWRIRNHVIMFVLPVMSKGGQWVMKRWLKFWILLCFLIEFIRTVTNVHSLWKNGHHKRKHNGIYLKGRWTICPCGWVSVQKFCFFNSLVFQNGFRLFESSPPPFLGNISLLTFNNFNKHLWPFHHY